MFNGSPALVMKKDTKTPASALPGKTKNPKQGTKASYAPEESIFQHRRMYEGIMEGFVYVDMKGFIKESNEVYQKMLGYTPEELSHLTYKDLTPRKWHKIEKKIVDEELLPNGYSSIFEKEYRRKDGTIFPVELRTAVLKNKAGKGEGMWAFVRDITERKKRDELLIENDYWLKESQRIGRLGSYTLDIKNNRYACSDVLDAIFGIDQDSEKTFETWNNLIVPEQQDEMMDYFQNYVIGDRQPFDKEYEIIRQNDHERRWVWGHGELLCDEDGTPVTMFGIIQDIHERKKAEETLRRSEIEYRDTLNAVPDMVLVVDPELRLLTANRAFLEECKRHGLPENYSGKKITGKIPFINSSITEAINYTFLNASGLVISQKINLSDKNIFAEFRILPFIKSKKVNKVITLIRDRSKEVENEELKLKNLEQKEVLLREIHHRVKNNLSIVISLLNFQLRKHTDPTLSRIILDIQMRMRSMALIHEHLYLSETLDRIPLASYIGSLISYISSTFRNQQVRLETHMDQVDIKIETALPLGLIINELLTNAFKYAFAPDCKGLILIDLKKDTDGQVILVVSDNGIGLPETVSTGSEKSLGLFIVGLLVEQLEGSIEIVRQKGTEFRIMFKNLVLPGI